MTIFTAAFLLSLDSFFASITLGAFGIEPKRYAQLAIAFGLCDGAASLAGEELRLPSGILTGMASREIAVVMALCLIAVVLVLFFKKSSGGPMRYAWAVPVIMGVDNLVNPEFVFSSYVSILVVILVSSSMSFAGFRLSEHVVRILRKAMAPFWWNRAKGNTLIQFQASDIFKLAGNAASVAPKG